jgi:hypothetical protein
MDLAGNVVAASSLQPIPSGFLFYTKPSQITMTPIQREQLAYLGMKTELLRDTRYNGKYIAILGGKLVDSDEELPELAKRVYSKYGYIPILMTKVVAESRKFESSSPEKPST